MKIFKYKKHSKYTRSEVHKIITRVCRFNPIWLRTVSLCLPYVNTFILFVEKKEEGSYELYWCPLISCFTGMRMGEITQFYLENVLEIKGNNRKK